MPAAEAEEHMSTCVEDLVFKREWERRKGRREFDELLASFP